MNQLTFKRSEVKKLVDHTTLHPKCKEYYGDPTDTSLLIVGDNGIYLMSNSTVQLPGKNSFNYVVYAKECNPTTNTDWYENKRRLWGGDDSADPLPISMFKNVDWNSKAPIKIFISSTEFRLEA